MKKIATLLLLVMACTAWAQQPISDKSAKKAIEASRKFIDSIRIADHLPGVSICVGTKDKILWAEGLGYADLENQVPVTTNSVFRMGSVSKVITSLAVGRLYQQGKLNLDVPIQQYLPDFPTKQYPFTARQLASHTAGIRHYAPTDPIQYPKRYNSVKEALAIFSNDSLLFKPATNSNYSSYGFNLLSAVLEVAAQRDFLSYMKDSVFIPYGMTRTFPDYNDSIITGRVGFYEVLKNGTVVNAALVDNSYKWAGGGFLSRPVDLVTMIQGIMNHRVLNEQTTNELFKTQILENGKNTNVGIAWRVNETKAGVKYMHHGGVSDGGRTFVFFYPESGYIFAIAANTSGAKYSINEAIRVLDYFMQKK